MIQHQNQDCYFCRQNLTDSQVIDSAVVESTSFTDWTDVQLWRPQEVLGPTFAPGSRVMNWELAKICDRARLPLSSSYFLYPRVPESPSSCLSLTYWRCYQKLWVDSFFLSWQLKPLQLCSIAPSTLMKAFITVFLLIQCSIAACTKQFHCKRKTCSAFHRLLCTDDYKTIKLFFQ